MTYTTIVAGVGDLTDNAHVIDRACEMARLNDAVLLLVAGFDPVAPRDRARLADAAPDIRPVEARLTEDEAYEVVEKARDIALERGVGLAQGVVVEGEAVSALTLVAIETQADLVVVGSRGVDSLLGRLFGAVSIQVLRKSRCDVLVVVEPDAAMDSAAAAALRAAANSVAAAAVEAVIREAAGDLLEEVRLFDVFRGPQLGEGRKSLAFSLRLRAPDRTLTAGELAGVRKRVVKRAAKRLGAELRA
mgnify:CR=1 FL=1